MPFLMESITVLRDAVLALLWTDLQASARLRAWLQTRYAARGQAPEEAYRTASLRLLGAVGWATLFVPWLALGLAWGSRESAHLGAPVWVSKVSLLLAWLLAWAYGRGVLQWFRVDAWRRAIDRLCGRDPRGAAPERMDGLCKPKVVGGAVLRRWKVARLWAWMTALTLLGLVWLLARGPAMPQPLSVMLLGAALWLLLWMVQRYDRLVAAVFDLSLARSAGGSEGVQDKRRAPW